MTVDYRTLFVLLSVCITGLLCSTSSSLSVIQKPSYIDVDYSVQQTLRLGHFKNILLSLLGFTVNAKNAANWNGITSTQPKLVPNATLIFLVDNTKFYVSQFSSKSVQLVQDVPADFDFLNTYFSNTFGDVNLVQTVSTLTNDFPTLQTECSVKPGQVVYIFNVPSSLSQQQVTTSIDKIITTFSQQCTTSPDGLLALLLAIDQSSLSSAESADDDGEKTLTRNIRAAGQDQPPKKKQGAKQANQAQSTLSVGNPAIFYNEQYPAMFNLFFWTGLILAVTVYAISYSLWFMDPGLDTVIYRMTSQRKKDN